MINRRKFLAASAAVGGGAFFADAKSSKAPFQVPADFQLKVLASNWGIRGSWDEFCANAKSAGYDGIEVVLPTQERPRAEFLEATEKYGLEFGLQASGGVEADFGRHFEQFCNAVERSASVRPLFVNCHSGRDFFSFEQNKKLIDFTISLASSTGVPIYHETHRARMLFAAHVARTFFDKIPELRITLDISHWCNVHGTLLADQQEAIDSALSRTDHIHARVGHAHSPQVTDPRAPEWANEVMAHFQWWDAVVKKKVSLGGALTIKTEFGPPHYMGTVPYTGQPLADLWELNVYMLKVLKERYGQ